MTETRSPKLKDWSRDPVAETLRLAAQTIELVSAGRLRDASRALAELSEVVWRQRPGVEPVRQACVAMLTTLREHLSERPDLALRAACICDLLYGREESVLEGFGRIAEFGTEREGTQAGDPWGLEAALYHTRMLGRRGREVDAVEAAAELLEAASRDESGGLAWIEFEAGSERCRALHLQMRWAEALDACRDLHERWASDADLPVRQREMLGTAMWIEAWSSVQLSEDQGGFSGGDASRLLDQQIQWLSQQPEPPLRLLLARRLADRFHWPADPGGRVDALEELTRVLETVGDRELVIECAELVLEQRRSLESSGLLTDEQRARLQGAVADVMARDQGLPSPQDVGISGPVVRRMERIEASLERLVARLADYKDAGASELRARILMLQAATAGLLGRLEDAERLSEELIELGVPTVAACSRIITEAHELETQGASPALGWLLSALQIRAGVLRTQGETITALADYREIIDRFGDSGNPAMREMVEFARKALTELDEHGQL